MTTRNNYSCNTRIPTPIKVSSWHWRWHLRKRRNAYICGI